MVYGPNGEYSPIVEKTLWPQWNIASRFIASMEKAWLHERFYFEGVIITVKDKKILYKRYNVNQN